MKLAFTHRHIGSKTWPGWDEWVCGPYKIVSYAPSEYYAYYNGKHVRTPVESVPCAGCGSAHCMGWHMCWVTLGSAKRDCERHALTTQLEE